MKWLAVFVFFSAGVVWIDSKCQDRRNDCERITSLCKASPYFHEFMGRFCARTCGFCNDFECGKPKIQGVRVIGGKTAARGSWPWQILLLSYGEPICGGALIGTQWIVTAAHCVEEDQHSNFLSVRVGEHDRSIEEGSEMDIKVEKVIIHPAWNARTVKSDLALLKLNRPVQFNKYVSPVCLPSENPPVGSKCYITGWGKMKHPGPMTNLLQQGELPVISNEDCYEHNKNAIPLPMTNDKICGRNDRASVTSACHGDSGGPYVCLIGNKWELHGTISHGSSSCKSAEALTVFSRIFYFKNWILKQTETK